MNCFNHADRAAVGTCKACHKGLCTECAADLGHGLACRGVHEQRVTELEQLISRNSQLTKSVGRMRYVAPVFMLFMGLCFTGFGLSEGKAGKLLVLMGLGFVVYGLYAFFGNRRAFGAADPSRK